MPTFVSRDNNSTAVPMSESDNDDDIEQNSSSNQHNESMIYKVKDVVSKLLHPSFLFSTSGDANRPKRKREISAEENGDHRPSDDMSISDSNVVNGHSTASKSNHYRQMKVHSEPQLTDDEDNVDRSVSPTEQSLKDNEQQKKRRRTTHYQHITSTATSNGNHEGEESSVPLSSTNTAGLSFNRRVLDNGLIPSITTPVLLQSSAEQKPNEETKRPTSTKQRFNIPSTSRDSTLTFDPSQSPLFTVNARKTTETPTSSNRTKTNLKSNLNEFSSNYLLATGLVNRTQPIVPSTQQTPSSALNRSSSNERQVLGVNYASINSRRLPYIERLRRRTLQDCIRLNRTLDSEPLSISTIEEHTSSITATPVRKTLKAAEKECGIQCNISTTTDSMEPSRKMPRTFPPADIRDEALSIPTAEVAQSTCQTESFVQLKSSITIEPVQKNNDITKPKILGNITPFSWPKFARAQEEFSKHYPNKCRNDSLPAQSTRIAMSIVEKPSTTVATSLVPQTNANSTTSKMPIFSVSPPRSTKPVSVPIWKCPSCSMEHPAQTASCSLCHRINSDYKRPNAVEATAASASFGKLSNNIVEKPAVSITSHVTELTTPVEVTPTTTTSTLFTTSKENVSLAPPPLPQSTAAATTSTTNSLSGTTNFPTLGFTPISTSDITRTTISATTMPLFPSLSTLPTTTASTVTPITLASSSFGTATVPLFGTTAGTTLAPTFGTLSSTSTTTPPATTTTTAPISSTTAASIATTSISPLKPATVITFGSLGSSSVAPTTTTAANVISSTFSTEKPPVFAFGASSTVTPSVPATTVAVTTTPSTNIFAFGSNSMAPVTTTSSFIQTPSLTLPTSSLPPLTTTASGLPFSAGFTSNPTAFAAPKSLAAPLFGSISSAITTSSSGFSFPTSGTTITTASNSTPFAFGASSPPKTFAPSVVSSTGASLAPTFGANASFGGVPTASTEKASASLPAFSGFGSSSTLSSFSFGASSTTAINPVQSIVPPTGTNSGFAFSPVSNTATAPAPQSTFGSNGSSFAFGASATTTGASTPFQFSAAPTFSFGANTTTPTGSPYQFSGSPVTSVGTPLSGGFPGGPEKNPFSVGEEVSSGRSASRSGRPVIKAKRQAKS